MAADMKFTANQLIPDFEALTWWDLYIKEICGYMVNYFMASNRPGLHNSSLNQGQANAKGRPFTFLAGHINFAAVFFNDLAGYT